MNETDELRKLLNERGVEYETADSYGCKFTRWRNNEIDAGWDDSENWEQPHLLIIGFTPEQAIEATVGSNKVETVLRKLIARLGDAADFHFATKYVDCIVEEYAGKLATLGTGTCQLTDNRPWFYPYECSECGAAFDVDSFDGEFNFCPNCGRRIEKVEE